VSRRVGGASYVGETVGEIVGVGVGLKILVVIGAE
jgi:hypothetical protein